MLLDGIFVLINGKYIGPEKPGPWANLFYFINVFKLGPLFIFFGILWLTFLFIFYKNLSKATIWGLVLSILTLWYLPFGTINSIFTAVILIYFRKIN